MQQQMYTYLSCFLQLSHSKNCCRAWYKHTAVTLGNDNTQGRTADFIVFNGVSREWEHDVEQHGNTGHNQVFLNIGETYHAWIMVQVRRAADFQVPMLVLHGLLVS